MTLKRWEIKVPNPTLREELAKTLHLHPVTAQLLLHRGVETVSQARAFLSHDLAFCHDPFALKDMEKAVGRLKRALRSKEKVLIWGDYDVDGVTSTSLLLRSLNAFGFHTLHHIPHRLTDGYGLNKKFLTLAKKKGVSVVISVDTGIAGHEAVSHLKDLGMELILTDHHEPKEDLPKAYAIINPLQKGCEYPFRFLSGVGLSYKLAMAVAKVISPEAEGEIQRHLDLVAVGTVADMVPMIGENRILVYQGLRSLEKTQKPGLRALLSLGKVRRQTLVPRDIGFIVAPRINASGRLGSAETALQLLLTDDEMEAEHLSQQLETGNKDRRRIEGQMLKEAIAKVEREINFKYERVIVLQEMASGGGRDYRFTDPSSVLSTDDRDRRPWRDRTRFRTIDSRILASGRFGIVQGIPRRIWGTQIRLWGDPSEREYRAVSRIDQSVRFSNIGS